MHHKACSIACFTCNQLVHFGCIIDQYKLSVTSVAPLKNSLEWLKGLLLSVVEYLKESLSTSPTANDVHKYVSDISSDGVWVEEDIIATAADHLQRNIYVYMSTSSTLPLVYCPQTADSMLPSLCIAFYEPGHFKAVLNATGR